MSELPVVSVHIPLELRTAVGGHDEVMASGETVGDVLRAVGNTYPDFAARVLCGDGSLAEGLSVCLGGCTQPQELSSPVGQEEVLAIVATGVVACAVPAPARELQGEAPAEALISIGD
ncbi:MAG TPA: hypothetical protein VK165_14725 [Azonexus sp.]|nr:hypothetical protein [Azonexus sp.]